MTNDDMNQIWEDYRDANGIPKHLDDGYLAFTIEKFFEKIEPLIPLLGEKEQLKVEYLKALNANDSFQLEFRTIKELRLHHHSDDVYRYLFLLWEGGQAEKFPDVLRGIIEMLIRISLQGVSRPLNNEGKKGLVRMKPILSDEGVVSASDFILKYNIPLDWEIYVGIDDGVRRFVAATGPYIRKYDEDDWYPLGFAEGLVPTAGDLSIDAQLIMPYGGCEPMWGIFNGNPTRFNQGDMFNRHLFDTLWVGEPKMEWESLFPQLFSKLEDIGFSTFTQQNILTRYHRTLGGEVYVRLFLEAEGFFLLIENEKAYATEFNLEWAIENDSTETREELIRFVVSVNTTILEWIRELEGKE